MSEARAEVTAYNRRKVQMVVKVEREREIGVLAIDLFNSV